MRLLRFLLLLIMQRLWSGDNIFRMSQQTNDE